MLIRTWSQRGTLLTKSPGFGLISYFPTGPCAEIVYIWVPMYLFREYLRAKVYTIWVHGRYMDPYTLNPYRTLKGALKGTLKGTLKGYMDPCGLDLGSRSSAESRDPRSTTVHDINAALP